MVITSAEPELISKKAFIFTVAFTFKSLASNRQLLSLKKTNGEPAAHIPKPSLQVHGPINSSSYVNFLSFQTTSHPQIMSIAKLNV